MRVRVRVLVLVLCLCWLAGWLVPCRVLRRAQGVVGGRWGSWVCGCVGVVVSGSHGRAEERDSRHD